MPKRTGQRATLFSSPEELAQRRYLRPSEFCILYGRSRSWLAKAVRDGLVESTKLGSSLMISAASAEKLFKEGY